MCTECQLQPPTSLTRDTASTTVLHHRYPCNGHARERLDRAVDTSLWLKGSQPTHASTWSKKVSCTWVSLNGNLCWKPVRNKAEAKRKPADRVGLTANHDHVLTKWWESKTFCKQRKFGSREKKTVNQSAAKVWREGERSTRDRELVLVLLPVLFPFYANPYNKPLFL